MDFEYQYKSPISILLITILLHSILLLAIFCDIKVMIQSMQDLPSPPPEKNDWAQRKPKASHFGTPVIFTTTNNATKPLHQSTTQQHHQKKNKSLATEKQLSKSSSRNTINKNKQISAAAKQLNSSPTMANLLKGFLEQTGKGNDNGLLHKGINKSPPDEQIKYERYIQKIHWCIQNSFRINKHKLYIPYAIRTIIHIYINFRDNGTIQEVTLLNSSGSPQLDQYIIRLIQDAGKSFPPFPTFLDIKLIPKTYSIHIDVPAATTGSNLTMSL